MRGGVLLGHVLAPTGVVLLYDFGNLQWWSSFELSPHGEECVDLQLVGPTAAKAAAAWGTPTGRIHDVPRSRARDTVVAIRSELERLGVPAKLRTAGVLPPLERCRRMVRDLGAASGVFGGLQGAVVRDVPTDVLEVRGFARRDDSWRRVVLVCRSSKVVRREKIGFVTADWARLMFADPTALADWRHEETLDGLADFVFWGRDASEAAGCLGAPALGDQWGWTDLPIAQAAARGEAVERWRAERTGLKFATDFRPHSHHFALMAQLRGATSQSGSLDLARGRVCGFHTRIGDGAFDVWCEYDAQGRVVSVAVEL